MAIQQGRRSRRAAGRAIAAAGLVIAAATFAGDRRAVAQQEPAPEPARHATGVVRNDLEPIVEQLLALLGQIKIDDMLSRMPVGAAGSRDELPAVRHQLAALTDSAGKYSGFDVVGYQTLGPRYCEVYALAYFANQPALFEFGFYRPAAAWQVQSFRLRSDFHAFLEGLPVSRP